MGDTPIPGQSEITKLRSLLIKSNIPQYQVAARMGLHPSTLSAYSLGKESIKPYHLVQICQYFQLEPEDVIGYTYEFDVAEIEA